VPEPKELFSLMVNAELLSPGNLYFLATGLASVHRWHLRDDLLGSHQFEGNLIVLKTAFFQEEPPYVHPSRNMQFVNLKLLINWLLCGSDGSWLIG